MAQAVSYGSITIVDTNDIKEIYMIYAGSDSSDSMPTFTYAAVTGGTIWKRDASQITGDYIWQSTVVTKSGVDITSSNWTSFYGVPVCITGPEGIDAKEISAIETQYCNYGNGTPGSDANWQNSTPAYDATKPNYWTRTRLKYDDADNTYSSWTAPVKNQALTDAIYNAYIANSIATHAQEDAEGALSQAAAAQQLATQVDTLLGGHFIFGSALTLDTPAGARIIEQIENGGVDVSSTPSEWHHNVIIGANGINLRYNEAVMAQLAANQSSGNTALTFYQPPTISGTTTTQGKRTMELSGGSLKFYDPASNSGIPIAEYSSGITLGRTDGSQSYLDIDAYSVKAYDKENAAVTQNKQPYFNIGDLRTENGGVARVSEDFILGAKDATVEEVIHLSGSTADGYIVIGSYIISDEETNVEQNVISKSVEKMTKTGFISYTGDGEESAFSFELTELGESSIDFIDNVIIDNVATTDYVIVDDGYIEFGTTQNDEFIPNPPANGAIIKINYSYNYCQDNIINDEVNIFNNNILVASSNYIITTINDINAVIFNKDYVPSTNTFILQYDSNNYSCNTNYIIKDIQSITVEGATIPSGNYSIQNDRKSILFNNYTFSENSNIKINYNTYGYKPRTEEFIIVKLKSTSSDYQLVDNAIIFNKVIQDSDRFNITIDKTNGSSVTLRFNIAENSNIEVISDNEIVDPTKYFINNQTITFTESIERCTVKYNSDDSALKTFTLGTRVSGSNYGGYSVSLGFNNAATENYSYAEGLQTFSQGKYGSHSEGYGTNALGNASHAEGRSTTATGIASHAENYETYAVGDYSHAEGNDTEAVGDYSHAQNLGTIANGVAQTVIGKYNDITNSEGLFIIGGGTNDNNRKTVFRIGSQGGVYSGKIFLPNDTSIAGYNKNKTIDYKIGFVNNNNCVVLGDSATTTIIRGKNKGSRNTYILNANGFLTLAGGINTGGSITMANGQVIQGYKKKEVANKDNTLTIGFVGTDNYVYFGDSTSNGTVIRGRIYAKSTIYLPNNAAIRAFKKGSKTVAPVLLALSSSNNIVLGNYNNGNPNCNVTIYGKNFYVSELGNITKVGSIYASGAITSGGRVYLPNNTAIKGYKSNSTSATYTIGYVASTDNVIIGDNDTNTIICGKNKGSKNTYILNANGYLTLGSGISCEGAITCGSNIYLPNNTAIKAKSKNGSTEYNLAYVDTDNYVNVGDSQAVGVLIRGIYTHTTGDSANVHVDSTGVVKRYASSSERYKKYIKDVSLESLNPEHLYDIEVKQFKYTEKMNLDKNDSRYNKTLIGFIAEQVYEHYPIAVDMNSDGTCETWNPNYIIPPMLALIQEQKKQIDKLEERVAELEK